jgi:hypothetical protein
MIPVIIEVAISLIVVYFLMSTLVSFIQEMIAMALSSRGELLKKSLGYLFEEEIIENQQPKKNRNLFDSFYKSKFLQRPFKRCSKSPDYINPSNFYSAIYEKINPENEPLNSITLRKKIEEKFLNNSIVKQKLLEIINQISVDTKTFEEDLKAKVIEWFNIQMDSLTVIYRNYSRAFILAISSILCIGMNLDSLVLFEYFYENKDKRTAMVQFAEQINKNNYFISDSIGGEKRLDSLNVLKEKTLKELNTFNLPINWVKKGKLGYLDTENALLGNEKSDCWFLNWAKKVLGIFLTIVALTLGAPFWFQLMVKLLNLRKEINGETIK